MKFIVAFLALTTLASAVPKVPKPTVSNIEHAGTKPDPRLVGSRIATPNSLPYQVLLFTQYYFSGALISQNYVVTAATYLHGKNSVDLILGAHNRTYTEDTQVKMTSTEILIHPDYDNYYFYNLGIVRLPLSVRLSPAIRPISLPSQSDLSNDYTGALATASNWRTTDYEGTDYFSEVLNYMQATVIPNTECSDIYTDITPELLCANGDSTTCHGDTGSPLVTNGVLIGISAFISAHCPNALPSGFTRITSVLPWILANTDA